MSPPYHVPPGPNLSIADSTIWLAVSMDGERSRTVNYQMRKSAIVGKKKDKRLIEIP